MKTNETRNLDWDGFLGRASFTKDSLFKTIEERKNYNFKRDIAHYWSTEMDGHKLAKQQFAPASMYAERLLSLVLYPAYS
jgi:hypothetical protein